MSTKHRKEKRDKKKRKKDKRVLEHSRILGEKEVKERFNLCSGDTLSTTRESKVN